MAPPTPEAEAHQILIDQLDIHAIPKPFRSAHWKPNQRRNKNIKTIIGDVIRKEASTMATQDNSGAVTPLPDDSVTLHGICNFTTKSSTGITEPIKISPGKEHEE
ncbi:hypothetical protein M7I_6848 [Glarea lozoyensis 74030]|uniref:Uncharacterized protein n=1 Tax=Glarea lozoyensis (strain ATCC 74030 / MF5533) TaxID=1104152 RepID=H0EVP7_GLAL7|nr:hypothetical protein M7I_6848 [Glarea lozoyensis 74030]